jgi:hypothetical protein
MSTTEVTVRCSFDLRFCLVVETDGRTAIKIYFNNIITPVIAVDFDEVLAFKAPRFVKIKDRK